MKNTKDIRQHNMYYVKMMSFALKKIIKKIYIDRHRCRRHIASLSISVYHVAKDVVCWIDVSIVRVGHAIVSVVANLRYCTVPTPRASNMRRGRRRLADGSPPDICAVTTAAVRRVPISMRPNVVRSSTMKMLKLV